MHTIATPPNYNHVEQHHALRGLPLPFALVGDEALARVLHRVQTQGLAFDRWLKGGGDPQRGLAAVLAGESDGACAM